MEKNKRRELIAMYRATEFGKTYNVYEYFDENGKRVIDKKGVDEYIKLENPDRNTLQGTVKKTDIGMRVCFEKLSSPILTLSEKGRYIKQLRHHTNVFISNYLKRLNKDIDEEQTLSQIDEKLNSIIVQFMIDHPNVDMKAVLEDLFTNADIQNDEILYKALKLQYNRLQNQNDKANEDVQAVEEKVEEKV